MSMPSVSIRRRSSRLVVAPPPASLRPFVDVQVDGYPPTAPFSYQPPHLSLGPLPCLCAAPSAGLLHLPLQPSHSPNAPFAPHYPLSLFTCATSPSSPVHSAAGGNGVGRWHRRSNITDRQAWLYPLVGAGDGDDRRRVPEQCA